jgi:histidyl-tRNA synthetase
MDYAIPKGVFDILPTDPNPDESWRNSDRWLYVEEVMRRMAQVYGFKEMRTPIFEKTELFVRSVGEGSDIVTKEMYTFADRAERSMTLRPEGTAPAIRAFVEKKLHQQSSVNKYYYIAPMFRYERQQAGRYRQHHQFGAEAIGIGTPEQDVELIDLLCTIYRELKLTDLNVVINSVGDATSRAFYKEAITAYLRPFLPKLSADSQVRFERNILRILDSKDPGDQAILENAPSILDFLSEECRVHFCQVQQLLKALKIPFGVNHRLVRGLDYYNKTVFEITSGQLGAQNSLGGGGRYDGLIKMLGGPDLPAAGFGTGLERIIQTLLKQKAFFPPSPHPFLFLVPIGEKALAYCFEVLSELRHRGIPSDMDLSLKKVQHGLSLADQKQADYSLVIGDEELCSCVLKLKHMKTRSSSDISLAHLLSTLEHLFWSAKNG